MIENLWEAFVFGKQTYRELHESSSYSARQLHRIFEKMPVKEKVHHPRPVALVVDTTFFGSKETGEWGVTVFRDAKEKENLWWMFVDEERLMYYEEGTTRLEGLDYTFTSVTCDGLPGLIPLFSSIPVQFCHFHQKKIVRKYVRKNPTSHAGRELLEVVSTLGFTNEKVFKHRLSLFIEKHRSILNETIQNSNTKVYTRPKLRSAVASLVRNIPYLFTYEKHPDLFIPKTTNTLEGHYSHIKDVVRIHRGLSVPLKQNMIHAILLNSSIAKAREM
jgi:hypothetical protein